ncbi:MAG: metal-dependent hydrolase [Candidatus Poribacteria bacterium]
MKFSQHVGVGVATYFIAVVPVCAWIVYRQGLPFSQLWENLPGIFMQYWWEILICFFLCVIGAMIPDVDIKSRSQMIVYALLFVIDIVLIVLKYYKASAIMGCIAMLPMLAKHRRQFHSYVAAVVIPAPFLLIPILFGADFEFQTLGVSYYVSVLAGYLSHIIADGEGDWD